jgi:pimeloyl-ACP methyl ester carboxylesterase
VRVVQTGCGPNGVVGFHGWSGDHATFDPLLKNLPEDVTFYSFDLPGCGQSPEPKKWEMKSLAREMAEELIRLGKRDLTLVGSCSGGVVAVFTVRELREMGKGEVVSRLVMIDPFGFCPWYFHLFLIRGIGGLMYAATFANPLGRWITNWSLKKKRAGKVHLTESFRQVNHRVTMKYLRMMEACGAPDQFQGMKIPVEILRGGNTFAAVAESVRMWQKALPQANVKVLEHVGHLPIDEASDAVREVVFRRPFKRNIPKLKKMPAIQAREARELRNELTRGDMKGPPAWDFDSSGNSN